MTDGNTVLLTFIFYTMLNRVLNEYLQTLGDWQVLN